MTEKKSSTPSESAAPSKAATQAGSAKVELCRLDEMTPNTARRFDVGDHRLSLIRLGDDVFVIGDECTHDDFSLSDGEVDADERTIECPKHGALFSIENGEPESLPATRAVATYVATVEDGLVKVVLT